MRRFPRSVLFVALTVILAGCGFSWPGATALPGPSISPGVSLDAGDLRLVLIDTLGPRWYCDPDEFPVAVADEQARAIARFPDVQAEGLVYRAVLRKLGMAGRTTFSDAEKLEIYRLWKMAVSIDFQAGSSGAYAFDYSAQPVGGATQGVRTTGTIDSHGAITIQTQAPTGMPNCPICLARGTRIDAPAGPVAVEDLVLGDSIWTLDASGRRVAGVVIALGSTVAPADHHVIRLTLADGRSVTASPGHPLADGRRLGDLRIGDVVDGSPVVGLESEPYSGGETFDLVASGPTGVYFSDGIALGTTLR
jgi:hypothetical protein